MIQRIRKNRLFILGAGFSVEAGIPLTKELLELAMIKFKSECPELYVLIENISRNHLKKRYEKDCSEINFSELCTFLEYRELREYGGGERWSNVGSREKLLLKFYLSKTIVEKTPKDNLLPKIYFRFAEQLHENDIIINFNWDCLLEVILKKIGKEYTYNFEENKIKLCKLHGSINWRIGLPAGIKSHNNENIFDWTPTNLKHGLMDEDIFYSPWLINSNEWKHFRPLRNIEPFIILPGFGKAFDVRFLSTLWYKPEFAFAFTNDVYIIGLSLTRDDFFIRSFFHDNLPNIKLDSSLKERKVIIINPDIKTKENYRFILKNKSVKLFNEKFHLKHVEYIEGKLKN